MYSIDINFLKDRPEFQGSAAKSARTTTVSRQTNYSKTPIYIGIGVGMLAMLVTGGGWLVLDQQSKSLQAKQAELDQKLGALKNQESELTSLNGKIAQIETDSKALAGVFNSVRPWSAILQDMRESIPQGVQIQTIGQMVIPVAPATPGKSPAPAGGGVVAKAIAPPPDPSKPSPSASASPSAAPTAPIPSASPAVAELDTPITKLKVAGVAQSFNDVNNFVLTLKKSAFFNPDDTQLIGANLVSETLGSPNNGTVITTKSVRYEIQTSLKQVPASELLRDLERKGAVGLVTRLKSLQQQQVIKP